VDDDKRAKYDQFGHAGVRDAFTHGGFDWSDFTHFGDISDIFGDLGGFGFGGGVFDQFFGRTQRRGPQEGRSLRYDIEVTLEEIANGVEKDLRIPRTIECKDCDGKGAKPGDHRTCPTCKGAGQAQRSQRRGNASFVTITQCPTCRGSGRQITKACAQCGGSGSDQTISNIKVSIPKGAEEGMRLRIRGAGEPSRNGGPPGDLMIVVHMAEHPVFVREGKDIFVEAPVSFSQAALGAQVEVPTMNGKALVTIPSGTQTGTVLRLKGKGLPDMRERGSGDQFVKVTVVTPTKLTSEQKELLRKFGQSVGEYERSASKKSFFGGFRKGD